MTDIIKQNDSGINEDIVLVKDNMTSAVLIKQRPDLIRITKENLPALIEVLQKMIEKP